MVQFIRVIALLFMCVVQAYGQIKIDTLPSLRKLLNRGNTVDSVLSRPDSIYWRHTLEAGFNLNQGSFSDNWKGGGVNSVALGLVLNGRLSHRHNRFNWALQTQLQYGIVKNARQSLRKSSDRVFADAKGGYRISTRWQWFGVAYTAIAVCKRV